jgi:hypothetical protein
LISAKSGTTLLLAAACAAARRRGKGGGLEDKQVKSFKCPANDAVKVVLYLNLGFQI